MAFATKRTDTYKYTHIQQEENPHREKGARGSLYELSAGVIWDLGRRNEERGLIKVYLE